MKNCNEIKTPKVLPYVKHVYHLYVIRVENRDKIQQKLKEQGIATGIHYPIPLHLQPAYKYLGYKENDFPITEKVSKEILSLPIYPELSVELQKWIMENLRSLSEDERKK